MNSVSTVVLRGLVSPMTTKGPPRPNTLSLVNKHRFVGAANHDDPTGEYAWPEQVGAMHDEHVTSLTADVSSGSLIAPLPPAFGGMVTSCWMRSWCVSVLIMPIPA